jgi:hypothetical protein
LNRIGQLVEPLVDPPVELLKVRWQLLSQLRTECRLRPRCPRCFLDHDHISGSHPVHDPVQRSQHGSHFCEHGIALRRLETNSLARIAGVRSRR